MVVGGSGLVIVVGHFGRDVEEGNGLGGFESRVHPYATYAKQAFEVYTQFIILIRVLWAIFTKSLARS